MTLSIKKLQKAIDKAKKKMIKRLETLEKRNERLIKKHGVRFVGLKEFLDSKDKS